MMMKSKNKKKRLVHFVKKMVVDFLTAQTRGHFYEMNQAPTFMNDFRCNHAWLSRIATNNKWNTSISEAQKPKDFEEWSYFGPFLHKASTHGGRSVVRSVTSLFSGPCGDPETDPEWVLSPFSMSMCTMSAP
jgi:hypothetical protein